MVKRNGLLQQETESMVESKLKAKGLNHVRRQLIGEVLRALKPSATFNNYSVSDVDKAVRLIEHIFSDRRHIS
jgi:hypothetical protein